MVAHEAGAGSDGHGTMPTRLRLDLISFHADLARLLMIRWPTTSRKSKMSSGRTRYPFSVRYDVLYSCRNSL